jgi:hypothetical protein
MRISTIGVSIAAVLLAAGAAQAKIVHFTTALKGADEVPANDTAGKGALKATLDTDTREFKYKVDYSGLTGPATMAHFHGPAAAGANAPPIITVDKLPNPMTGTAKLTEAQAADLTAGNWYFNIHTKAHPGGEVRGQLAVKP